MCGGSELVYSRINGIGITEDEASAFRPSIAVRKPSNFCTDKQCRVLRMKCERLSSESFVDPCEHTIVRGSSLVDL